MEEVIKVNVKNLPVGKPNSDPVINYLRKLISEGVDLNSRVEFYRDKRPEEWDFAISSIQKYIDCSPLAIKWGVPRTHDGQQAHETGL